MSEQGEKPKRRRRGRFGLVMLLSLALILALGGVAFLSLSGQPVVAPEWLRTRLVARVNAALPAGRLGIGRISLVIRDKVVPAIEFENLLFTDQIGRPLVRITSAEAELAPAALLQGRVQASALRLSGAELSLRRTVNGEFDLSLGLSGGDFGATGSLSQVLDQIDRAFEQPALAAIDTIDADQLTLVFQDARAGRNWVLTDGHLTLGQDAQSVDISLAVSMLPTGLNRGAGQKATASLSFKTVKGSPEASFGANVGNVPARDIASQVPALAWLAVVDAPISGAFRASIDANGMLGATDATLQIGAGELRPAEGIKTVGFQSGKAYFSYDPNLQKVSFDEFSIQTDAVNLRADGVAYLQDFSDGLPQTLLGQFHVDQARVDSEGVLEAPLAFSGGAADMRLRLDPFTLDIGQVVLEDGARRFSAAGRIHGDEKGWAVSLDLGVNEIAPAPLLALWPLDLIPNTRRWIKDNVLGGVAVNAKGALRLMPGQDPVMSLGFDFQDMKVRFMDKMPPVTGGAGYATIIDNALTVVLQKGTVTAANGKPIDPAGSVFMVPDIQVKSAPAVVRLKTSSSLGAVLSILDNPPFLFLSKADQPVDLATGRATMQGEIHLPLAKKVLFEDVSFNITGQLRDVVSEKLVPGRQLSAAKLAVRATEAGVEISGAGVLGQVPVEGSWMQKFGPENEGRSRLEGTVELSQRFVDEFRIGLPAGSVGGAGRGRIEIDFGKGAPARFKLLSDLNRVRLRLTDLGWSKPANRKGRLEVTGLLGTPPVIQKLTIDAAGLKATGSITLKADGALKVAQFSRVSVGGWLNAPVTLTGRGPRASPLVSVSGGMIDIRKTSFGRAGGTGSSGPLTLALDRLIVSEGITLTGLRGKFTSRPAFNGTFTAKVNGATPISGVLAPNTGGTAIRIRSKDAGGVFRSAGVLGKAHGGAMDLILIPRKGEEGNYDGRLTVTSTRIKKAPALADLLSAISGIGLLDQLNGGGITFSNVEASFRLTPKQVIVSKSSAVGPSLGVSMDGIYDLATKRMNMQGVISPIYLVNGVGQIFTRKGEGLFGFNFRLVGTSDNPRVKVNPLSILTPGMFREIFRRPPPKLPN